MGNSRDSLAEALPLHLLVFRGLLILFQSALGHEDSNPPRRGCAHLGVWPLRSLKSRRARAHSCPDFPAGQPQATFLDTPPPPPLCLSLQISVLDHFTHFPALNKTCAEPGDPTRVCGLLTAALPGAFSGARVERSRNSQSHALVPSLDFWPGAASPTRHCLLSERPMFQSRPLTQKGVLRWVLGKSRRAEAAWRRKNYLKCRQLFSLHAALHLKRESLKDSAAAERKGDSWFHPLLSPGSAGASQ